jgi:hypothetical protein
MITSEQIDKIAPAFVKAQAACNGAKKSSSNPHFKSKYADLSAVWDACEGALESNKLSVLQGLGEVIDGKMQIETMLLHDSGQWIKSLASIPLPKADPQGYGSASTYARRYTLAALMGIVQEDDDGNAARLPANDANARINNPTPAPKREKAEALAGPYTSKTALWAAVRRFSGELHGCGDSDMLEAFLADKDSVALLKQCERDAPSLLHGGDGLPEDYVPINALIEKMRGDIQLIENNTLRAG